EAWAKYAAEDAASGSLRGPAEIKAAQAKAYARPGYKLLWYPTDVKEMGSFIVTTGRWERHIPAASGEERILHGRYVTMWQKQKDGNWRWVWDGGEEDSSAK
ncbi:MAG TPA: hypothetical protein VNH18_04355, partial [Bryobacteraceae bacterium]|nr:hypothetical protein [Bryobacteraceae bacterium]